LINVVGLLAIMSAVLIIVGLGMVIFQMSRVSWTRPPSRKAQIGMKGITLQTTYPGLIVIGIGAVMMLAAVVKGS
jgi:hypothetical protein